MIRPKRFKTLCTKWGKRGLRCAASETKRVRLRCPLRCQSLTLSPRGPSRSGCRCCSLMRRNVNTETPHSQVLFRPIFALVDARDSTQARKVCLSKSQRFTSLQRQLLARSSLPIFIADRYSSWEVRRSPDQLLSFPGVRGGSIPLAVNWTLSTRPEVSTW